MFAIGRESIRSSDFWVIMLLVSFYFSFIATKYRMSVAVVFGFLGCIASTLGMAFIAFRSEFDTALGELKHYGKLLVLIFIAFSVLYWVSGWDQYGGDFLNVVDPISMTMVAGFTAFLIATGIYFIACIFRGVRGSLQDERTEEEIIEDVVDETDEEEEKEEEY